MRTEKQRAYDERRSKFLDLRMSNNPHWQGGRYKAFGGYMVVTLHPDDAYYSMAQKGGVCPEHRYIMARHLGRCLDKQEIVHHINHVRDDNRIENLQIINNGDGTHKYIDGLEKRIKYLEGLLGDRLTN